MNLDLDDIYEEIQTEPIKKKKKKKKNVSYASSAFDSNANMNESELHAVFRQLEFESKCSETLIVYLDHLLNEKKFSYRIKYDKEMNLVRVESLPIKWLSVDVRNENETGKKDIRFSVISQKEVKLGEDLNEREMLDKIKAGVLEKVKTNDEFEDKKEFLVGKDFRRCSQIFARYSQSTKYYSDKVDNWRSLFAMAKMSLPKNVKNMSLISLVRVCLSESNEYSEHDERDGGFGKVAHRRELIISFKLDVIELSASDLNDLACIVWHVAQVFLNI